MPHTNIFVFGHISMPRRVVRRVSTLRGLCRVGAALLVLLRAYVTFCTPVFFSRRANSRGGGHDGPVRPGATVRSSSCRCAACNDARLTTGGDTGCSSIICASACLTAGDCGSQTRARFVDGNLGEAETTAATRFTGDDERAHGEGVARARGTGTGDRGAGVQFSFSDQTSARGGGGDPRAGVRFSDETDETGERSFLGVWETARDDEISDAALDCAVLLADDAPRPAPKYARARNMFSSPPVARVSPAKESVFAGHACRNERLLQEVGDDS
jgi:hypothetical protein